MQAETIKQIIEAGLAGSQALVQGEDGVHFEADVICADFAGQSMLQQHRLVYATLGNRVADGTIHALALRTYTPEQWAKQNSN